MARIDFTERLRAMEESQIPEPLKYRRVKTDTFLPGIEIELYVNTLDESDVYFSAAAACSLLGLNRRWLNVAFTRPATIEKLKRLGFDGEKKMVDVLVDNSATQLTKPSTALDRKNFDALTDYAAELGKKEAKAIQNTFMILGLVSVAGLDGDAAHTRDVFVKTYQRCKKELEEA